MWLVFGLIDFVGLVSSIYLVWFCGVLSSVVFWFWFGCRGLWFGFVLCARFAGCGLCFVVFVWFSCGLFIAMLLVWADLFAVVVVLDGLFACALVEFVFCVDCVLIASYGCVLCLIWCVCVVSLRW